MDEFYRAFQNKTYLARYWREGRKIIGTLCNNVPEEVIHSLGAVPSRMLGLSKTTENANSKLPSWICSYARRLVEDALNGKFNYFDGVVGLPSDDTKMHLFSVYSFYFKPAFAYMLQMPYVRDEASTAFFEKEIRRFASKLSSHLLVDLAEEKLANSIRVYNEFRELCGEVSRLRFEDSPKLSGTNWMKLILGSTTMLKEDFNSLLRGKLGEIRDSEGVKDYKLRIHISGTDFYDLELFSLIERLGGVIVSDDLCTATGYFYGKVKESGSPFRSLAEYYLSRSACVLTSQPEGASINDRASFIKRMIEASRAEALIVLRDRGCEICGHQYPLILEEFHDFPVLFLDVDTPLRVEQYTTRLEAFIEAHAG